MGKREEESMEEVRWETLFLNRPVRVLLVEGDDSTRQIISALLRKCGYKVLSVSDGVKAWEAITGCHVDLVLTEVELPSLSGFGLLTMIMEHETCKNIPVIMMSSHDSVSVVFKCMLKGAADYLVKPIRKNELRNLWQHVWRRHLASGEHAGAQRNQDEKPVNGELEANLENNASNYSSDYVDCMDKNDGNTAKGSEAQSSCTRSDTEAESKYMKNMQETKQQTSKSCILLDTKMTLDGDEHDMVSMKHAVAEAEDKSVTLGPECYSSEVLADNGSSAVVAMKEDFKVMDSVDIDDATNEIKPKEAIDLIGVMDSQSNGINASEDHPVYDLLELSLRRTTQACSQTQENNEPKTLNHSNSSPFSLYTGRTPLPPSPIPMKVITEREKLLGSSSMKSQVIQVSGNMHERETSNSIEDTNPSGSGNTNQDEASLHLSLRAIPFPVPITWQTNGSLLQPMFTPQSSNAFVSTMPTISKEADHPNSADEVNAMLSEQLPTYHSSENKEEIAEIRDEQVDALTVIVDSNNSNINAEVGKNEVPFVHDGMQQMDFLRMNQREAALTKYRLKRKDRCYEKKVRYQSRKLLAEQRPRVKGQFVRQIQHYSSDSVTG